jgi:hypothetical protein
MVSLRDWLSGITNRAVVEVDDAVGEGFGGEEFEADGAVARLNEGDAFADEDGERRWEQQRFCAAPTVLPIVASFFTQPLRAGLTSGTPTALFRMGKFKLLIQATNSSYWGWS